jgi:hypothetical protein
VKNRARSYEGSEKIEAVRNQRFLDKPIIRYRYILIYDVCLVGEAPSHDVKQDYCHAQHYSAPAENRIQKIVDYFHRKKTS